VIAMSEKKSFKKLEVDMENFGPIKNASFDIKPLTIFVGPNNSGKSYSALLIHAFSHYIKEKQHKVVPELFWSEMTTSSLANLFENLETMDLSIIENLITFIKSKPSQTEFLSISHVDIDTLLRLGVGEFYSNIIKNKIESLFDSRLDGLIMAGKDYFNIQKNHEIGFHVNNDSFELTEFPKIEFEDLEYNYDPNIRFHVLDDEVLLSLNYPSLHKEHEKDEIKLILVLLNIYKSLGTTILKKLLKDTSYYLPASRIEVIQDLNAFMSHNIRNKDQFSSSILKDFAATIGEIKKEKTEFFELTKNFEEETINGSIVFLDPFDGLPDIYYKRNELKIPLHLASASITQLTPLFLYLKYIVKPGDTLIIEEPEAHINPKNQRILVKYLSKLVNSGLKIIITTHSDYIIEQVNNFILANYLENEILFDKFGYEKEDCLNLNDVSMYLFKEVANKEFEAKKIEIGKYGIEESSFSQVIDELYDESHSIKNELFG